MGLEFDFEVVSPWRDRPHVYIYLLIEAAHVSIEEQWAMEAAAVARKLKAMAAAKSGKKMKLKKVRLSQEKMGSLLDPISSSPLFFELPPLPPEATEKERLLDEKAREWMARAEERVYAARERSRRAQEEARQILATQGYIEIFYMDFFSNDEEDAAAMEVDDVADGDKEEKDQAEAPAVVNVKASDDVAAAAAGEYVHVSEQHVAICLVKKKKKE